MIYTTYFAKLKKLPENIKPIAICAKPPNGYTGPIYRTLAPKYDFFAKYKINGDKEEFAEKYIGQVLNQLNPARVVAELYYQLGLAPNTCDIALVCFEIIAIDCVVDVLGRRIISSIQFLKVSSISPNINE